MWSHDPTVYGSHDCRLQAVREAEVYLHRAVAVVFDRLDLDLASAHGEIREIKTKTGGRITIEVTSGKGSG